MSELRTDAQLATAYLAGDRGALAGIYDRFSAGLYDTAAAMLRDRHEAADAMQDVFLIAAERMGQLREPERLKPWLYAILRNEVYRRSRKRGRALPTDFSAMANSGKHSAEMAAPIAPDAEGEAVSAGEMAELVRSAACGLDERDQLVLELSVRQGLQGAELAAALGVSAEQGYTLVHRMRDRVERSLGALIVARAGRKDCPDLADVLRGWDGQFTVLIRKRVARHVEHCETCERTRKKAAPLALLGAAPAFAAPPDLRDKILARAGLPGAAPRHAYTFDSDGGFPRLVRHLRLPTVLLGATTAILIGVGGGAFVAADADTGSASPPGTEVTAPDTVSVTDDTVTDDTVTVTVTTLVDGSTTTATTAPADGVLTVSRSSIDLGATKGSGFLDLSNSGGSALDWTVQGDPSPFTISATNGSINPGQHRTFTAALSRSGMAEGDVQRMITFVSGGQSINVLLTASTEHPPVLTLDGPSGKLCSRSSGESVYVTWADESGILTPVTLHWEGPVPGDVAMTGSTNYLYAWLGHGSKSGTYTYTIVVTDTRGNFATIGGTFTLSLDYC